MGKSRRYDDESLLEAFASKKEYPKIHNNIFDMALDLPAGPVLDLCCSTGLLGRRIRDKLGLPVCAVEGLLESISSGKRYNVFDGIPVLNLWVKPATLGRLCEWINEHGVRSVVARRCLCVLSEVIPLADLSRSFAQCGVEAVLLEGQQLTSRATHPFGSANSQANAFGREWQVVRSFKDVRFLVPRTDQKSE